MGAMVRYGEEMRQSKSGPFDALAIPLNAPWYISVTIKMQFSTFGRWHESTEQICVLLICSTPLGCIELIQRAGGPLSGKHVVVLGRSNIVGLPAAIMALHADATVTCCHSRTQNLPTIVRQADVLVAAIGMHDRSTLLSRVVRPCHTMIHSGSSCRNCRVCKGRVD